MATYNYKLPSLDSTPPLPKVNQCAVCKTEQGTTACSGCKVLFYCGKQHQKEDWLKHKKYCKAVKSNEETVWRAMEHIKHSLKESGGDHRAYFQSGPQEVEAYCAYNFILARNLIKSGTYAGVSEGLKRCQEVALLDKANKQNGQQAREWVPGLLLRLDRDEECYNFIKEKCNGDLGEIYRCQDGKPIHKANAENFSLAHAAMLCILKLRILRDLRYLDQADIALGDKLPAELFHESRSYLLSNATKMDPARMQAIEKREDLQPHVQKIETDLQDLRGYINTLNIDYFHAIADPEKYRKMQPMYQPEIPIVEVLHQTYDVWAETPGVFKLCQDLCALWDNNKNAS